MASPTSPDSRALEARIGYVFADKALLDRALTHISAVPTAMGREQTYQRLEFLGDRVLGLVVSDMLYQAFPDSDEGDLSRRLANLVRRESCAEVAASWEVGDHLRLGSGEAGAASRANQAILSDACEALIGAVFCDGGFAEARAVVERAFAARLAAPRGPLRDAKSALQEWAQGRKLPAPAYDVLARSGPDHSPHFHLRVTVESFDFSEGHGSSKRIAEQSAARDFLTREGIWTTDHG